MKKTIILLGIVLFAGTSCSNDELRETKPGDVIDFRAAIETRASETTTDNLESFYVTALDSKGDIYFTDVEFIKSEDADIFTAAGDKFYYWPADKQLTFYAYAPSADDLDAEITINSTTKTIAGYTPADYFRDQKDIVVATETAAYSAEGTALEFKHILSQIEILGKNDNKGYVYHVKGIEIGNVIACGDYDFSTGEWTPASGNISNLKSYRTSEYNIALKTETGTEKLIQDGGNDENAMMIPQQLTALDPDDQESTGAYIAVAIMVETTAGTQVFPEDVSDTSTEYEWVKVGINTNWEPGIKYIYTLDFTTGESILGEPFKFSESSKVIGWTDSSAAEQPEV